MDLTETVTIQSIITISLAVITILNFFSTRGRNAREDTNKEAENRVRVNDHIQPELSDHAEK